jgi:hypothetical protein
VRASAAVIFASAWIGCAAQAIAEPVDLELVIAVDASASMEAREQHLQRSGYVAAFRSAAVIAAVRSGRYGRIAVAFVEWAGADYQRLIVPWTVIDGSESAEKFAQSLLLSPSGKGFGTSIAQALRFSQMLLRDNGLEGTRLAIDVSGDGINNVNPRLPPARAETLADGITINGLPIMIRAGSSTGLSNIPDLDRYYRDCVIGGPNAFMIVVTRRAELASAIERKLLSEILSEQPTGIVPIGNPRLINCEK